MPKTVTDTHALPKRMSDQLYHDFMTPDEVNQVRARVREVATRVVAPRASQIANGDERVDGFAKDVFDALAEEKIFAIPFKADVGGAGLKHPASATAVLAEELAYFSNSVAAIVDVHCILAGNALDQGSAEQRKKWLAPLIRGEMIGAFATSEPASSSDLSPNAVQTKAQKTADGWLLNGKKRWITNSPVADFIVVLAGTGEGLSLFIVTTDSPGLTVGLPDKKMGNRGQLTADVTLQDVFVPHDRLLGNENEGLRIALSTLTYGRVGIAAAGVGMAQAAFDKTVAHLIKRHAFGSPLAAKQHWQFLMAERAMQIEAARSMYLKAALRIDQGVKFAEPEAGMAKMLATKLAVEMASDAIQAQGGLGFVVELGSGESHDAVEAIYRDAKIGEIYEGANEIQKWIIARQIFGKEITG